MRKLADLYDRAFKTKKPGDLFWAEVDAIDLELTKSLNKRPTTQHEIDAAGAKAIKAFVDACVTERAR